MSEQVKRQQAELNRWTKRWLRGVTPLIVDGDWGEASKRRTRWVKWYLGYGKGAKDNDSKWTQKLVRSLRHPKEPRDDGLTRHQVEVGEKRRRAQKRAALKEQVNSVFAKGVT